MYADKIQSANMYILSIGNNNSLDIGSNNRKSFIKWAMHPLENIYRCIDYTMQCDNVVKLHCTEFDAIDAGANTKP